MFSAGRVGNLALFSCRNGASGQVFPKRGLRTVATAPQCGRPPECARQDGAKLTTSPCNTCGRGGPPPRLGYLCGFIAHCALCCRLCASYIAELTLGRREIM